MPAGHAHEKTIWLFEEVTFGVPPADWDASGTAFWCLEPDFSGVARATVDNENYRQRALATKPKEPALRHGEYPSFGVYCHGHDTAVDTDTQATSFFISNLVKNAWGGEHLGYSATTDSYSQPTLTVDTGEGANFAQGDFVFLVDTDTGEGEFVPVDAVSTDDLTLRWDVVTFTPAADDRAAAVVASYLDTDALTSRLDANHTTHSFLQRGDLADDVIEASGVKLTLSSVDGLEAGASPVLRFGGMGTTHDNDGVSRPSSDPDPVGDAQLVVGTSDDMLFLIGTVGDDPVDTEVYSSSFGPGLGSQRVPGYGGGAIEGTLGYHLANADDMTFAVTFPFDDQWMTDFENGTRKHLLLQVGTLPGRAFGLYFPNLEIVSDPSRAVSADETAVTVTFRALENEISTSETGDQLEVVRSKAFLLWSCAIS
jgi:hypothetical protein